MLQDIRFTYKICQHFHIPTLVILNSSGLTISTTLTVTGTKHTGSVPINDSRNMF